MGYWLWVLVFIMIASWLIADLIDPTKGKGTGK